MSFIFFIFFYNIDDFDFFDREWCCGCRGGFEYMVMDVFGKVEVFVEGGLEWWVVMVELKYLLLLKSFEKYFYII